LRAVEKPRLIAIAGPTASGKSVCAVKLCRLISGEVVSADSMQIYRGMDIGTAKPAAAEMEGVPHHMLGVADPIERWSAARYRQTALPIIYDIISRGKQPVLCGGSGLYIDAVTRPMGFAQMGDDNIRAELAAIAEQPDGHIILHEMLKAADPKRAVRLHINDTRRVIRALEIQRLTGMTMSEMAEIDARCDSEFNTYIFGLSWPRDILYERIDVRVDDMIKNGLVREVEGLIKSGMFEGSTAAQALGYKEIAASLESGGEPEDMINAVKQATRNYAKRQLTWFRRDTRMVWIDAAGRPADDIAHEMLGRIA
jgi:tRNA dimethylallyltransferase